MAYLEILALFIADGPAEIQVLAKSLSKAKGTWAELHLRGGALSLGRTRAA